MPRRTRADASGQSNCKRCQSATVRCAACVHSSRGSVQSSNRRTSARISSVVRNVVASSVRIDISLTPNQVYEQGGMKGSCVRRQGFDETTLTVLPVELWQRYV